MACVVESILPFWVTVVYGAIQLLLLVALLGYLTIKLEPHLSLRKRLWNAIVSVKKKKSCYFPFLTHLFDQSTDVGVIIQFYQLWQSQENASTSGNDNKDNCTEINGFLLCILSIVAFFGYRIVSSVLVGIRTKSYLRAFLQFWDVMLFYALYLNYTISHLKFARSRYVRFSDGITNDEEQSSVQKWLQMMEATFEAFPQSLIQLYFIFQTGHINKYPIITLSLLFSIYTLTSKLISDDSILFSKCNGKTLFVNKDYLLNEIKEKESDNDVVDYSLTLCKIKNCCSKSKNKHGNKKNKYKEFYISWVYVKRVLFRMIEIVSRLLLLLQIWLIVGGIALLTILLFEIGITSTIARKLHELSWLKLFFQR